MFAMIVVTDDAQVHFMARSLIRSHAYTETAAPVTHMHVKHTICMVWPAHSQCARSTLMYPSKR